ncbi:MAG: mandelate racemase/muconate lactonizing enzyme family protein [Thaumarchaeota archaeon]|nr:mandelate racemase/muconate lactonizing enzyme family protein [Nitrososphaerota archaeon]
MRITKVEPIILYAQDDKMGGEANVGGYTGYQLVVRVDTDEGIHGWGEACVGSENGEAAYAVKELIERGIAPRVIGENPVEFRKIWERLYEATYWYGRRGLATFALSGIDTALVDITGKAFGIPACQVLGGQYKTEIPMYASLLFDMEDPEGTAKKGAKYARAGYAGTKFGWGMVPSKPFGANYRKDEEMVATIREHIGPDTWLMIDVGRYVNWSVPYAVKMGKMVEKYDAFWLEEALPQDDLDGYAELARSLDVPVAFGEELYTVYDFNDVIKKKAADILQPDASKVGGISEMKRIIELAHINNVMWVPHNWSTAVNAAASIHLAVSSPDGFLCEFKEEPNPLVHDLVKRKFEVKKGKLQVPEGPGLGIEINEKVLAKLKVG